MKTQIMYRANLSFTQLNDYLTFMLKTGFITQKNGGGKELYIATQKGLDFLQRHSDLIRLLNA